jgi:hypothetical protein
MTVYERKVKEEDRMIALVILSGVVVGILLVAIMCAVCRSNASGRVIEPNRTKAIENTIDSSEWNKEVSGAAAMGKVISDTDVDALMDNVK